MIKIPNISIFEISSIIGNEKIESNTIISFVSLDSRETCTHNSVFFAIKGEKFDGFDFIEEAIKNGAALIVTNKYFHSNKAKILIVDDVKKALGLFAKYIYTNKKTICITGSVGKTTVTRLLKYILTEDYNVNATEKNNNNEIGVPITLLNGVENDISVVELG